MACWFSVRPFQGEERVSRHERFYRIDQLLNQHGVVSFETLQAALEVSRATLKRDLQFLRDRFHAPIVYDRDAGGYRFERGGQSAGPHYELPGLWFSAREIHALLTMHQLLANLDTGGLLGPHIKPLLSRLDLLLGSANDASEQIQRRIRLLTVGAREFQLDAFELVGSALLRRRLLAIDYHARGTDALTQRTVSPQRLVHYRHNWYLDAWCHKRDGLRSFAVDAIRRAEIAEQPCIDVDEAELDAALGENYGIFKAGGQRWATLRFSPFQARWVAAERWHPKQRGTLLADGRYELELPYAVDTELVMDILRHGEHCEVVGPPELRARVKAALASALARYRD